METGLDSQPSNSPEESGLRVDVIRHGVASYVQPDWRNPETADDLTTLGRLATEASQEEQERGKAEAIAKVRAMAEEIAASIAPDEEVVLWASPTGRTLETARVIREVFEEKDIPIRRKGSTKEQGIRVLDSLGEIKNFKADYYMALVDGGTLTVDGQEIVIDKSVTNPENLNTTEYFVSDAIGKIPQEVKDDWPKSFANHIDSIEKYAQVSGRMLDTIKRVRKLFDKKYRIIMVTHAGLADVLVRSYDPDAVESIKPQEYVTVERVADKLVVTHAGSFKGGDEQRDIFAEEEQE